MGDTSYEFQKQKNTYPCCTILKDRVILDNLKPPIFKKFTKIVDVVIEIKIKIRN